MEKISSYCQQVNLYMSCLVDTATVNKLAKEIGNFGATIIQQSVENYNRVIMIRPPKQSFTKFVMVCLFNYPVWGVAFRPSLKIEDEHDYFDLTFQKNKVLGVSNLVHTLGGRIRAFYDLKKDSTTMVANAYLSYRTLYEISTKGLIEEISNTTGVVNYPDTYVSIKVGSKEDLDAVRKKLNEHKGKILEDTVQFFDNEYIFMARIPLAILNELLDSPEVLGLYTSSETYYAEISG